MIIATEKVQSFNVHFCAKFVKKYDGMFLLIEGKSTKNKLTLFLVQQDEERSERM